MSGQIASSHERLSLKCRKILSVVLSSVLVLTLTVFTPGDFLSLDGSPSTAYAAQINYDGNISNYQDSSSGQGRTKTFSGDKDFPGTPNNGQDPAGGNYYQMAIDAQNQFYYVSMPMSMNALADWSVTGHFAPDRITNNGAMNGGDFIGINLYPRDAGSAANDSRAGGGGGLGLVGTRGAYGLNLDFFQNTNYGDPASGPYGAFRWTDGNGDLSWMGNRPNLFTRSGTVGQPDLRQWILPIRYTLRWFYNNGNPYITGELAGGGEGNWFQFDTRNTGGEALPLTVPASGYFNVALMSANGTFHQNFKASVDQLRGEVAASTTQVRYYLDSPRAELAPNSTILGGVGESIGIRGASTNVANDTYSYNGNVPANAYAQYKNGYHASRTYNYSDGKSDLTFPRAEDGNPYNIINTWDIYYAPDFQFARLFTDNTDPQGGGEKDNIAGVTNATMTGWRLSDTDLARAGKNYTVRAPNGQSYANLAAARAAVNTFDNTNNGAAQSDTTPQDFTVTYTNAFQQAIVRSITNTTGAPTTIATYNNTTNATTGTPNRPLEDGTSGNLKSNVADTTLPRTGYNYTVTGPNGSTYPTMQQAWAANNTWDLTNNPAGATIDSSPQIWTINYTGQSQLVNLVRSSADGRGPSGTAESRSGPSGSNITFTATDTTLAVSGYNYTVDVYDGMGARIGGPYNSLAAALTVQPKYDANAVETPAGTPDSQQQRFQVNYTPTNQNVTYHYVDANGNTIKLDTVMPQPTNADISTVNAPLIQDYVYRGVDSARSDSDLRVNGDGSSQIYQIYDMDPAIAQNANAAISRADTSAAGNETTVSDAKTNLQNTMGNTAATPQQIKDATTALNNAINSAETDRANARKDAETANNNVSSSAVRNDANVVAAENNLAGVLNNPGSTTQQIKDATSALNTAVANATDDRAAATTEANTAKDPANTAPVTHEPAVDQRLTSLNNLLNDPTSTADQIRQATSELNTAVTDAKTARDTANANAEAAKTAAAGTNQSNDQRVIDATNALNQLQQAAAADSDSATTAQINTATGALNDAVSTAAGDQTTARQDAADAMAPTNISPVSNEPGVVQRKNDLQTILDDPKSTSAQIQQATDALNNVVSAAKVARDDAKSIAQAAITKAQGSTPPPDAATLDEIAALNTTISNADADQAGALTANIIERVNALNTASGASDADHTAARQDAQNALSNTAPVTNEPDVLARKTELQNTLSNPDATTQQIRDATIALNDVVAPAKTARDEAVSNANTAISSAQGDAVASQDSAVKQVVSDLQNAITQASNDSAAYVTADIDGLRSELESAVSAANQNNANARQGAQDAIAASSPVSNEASIPAETQYLQDLINNPSSTTEQLTQATTAYNNHVSAAKTERDTATSNAVSAINAANQSPVKGESAVQQAIADLQNVMANAASNDSAALSKDIQAATEELKRIQQEGQAKRDSATGAANTAITDANNSAAKNNEDVIRDKDALQNLLNNPDSTLQQIEDATNTLNSTRQQAESDRGTATQSGQTAIDNANNSNVKGELPVINARDALQNLLNNPDSTQQQIEDATTALNDVVTQAQSDRQDVVNNANNSITQADPVKNQPTVSEAINDLQNVMSNPDSSTQQIKDAADRLDSHVENALRDRQAAKDAATAAMSTNNTAPVTNEPAVAAAMSNLQSVNENPASTTAQIVAATEQLNSAVTTAKDVRESVNSDAASLNNSTSSSPVGQEPGVVAAMNNLNQVMADAASDSSNALTSNIRAAMEQVQNAAAAAQTARDNAKQAISDANNSSVTNEQPVKDAKENLQNVLSNPASTSQQIADATSTLNDARQTAGSDRELAANDAQTAINNSNQPPNNNAQSVIDARNDLQNTLNSPASTTEDIKNGTNALNTANQNAYTARDNVVAEARSAMEDPQTQPVTHEEECLAAEQALEALISNPESTAEQIAEAIAQFVTVVEAARLQRESAISGSNERVEAAQTSEYADDPDVITALNLLNDVISRSRTDVASALSADIRAAALSLDNAVTAAAASGGGTTPPGGGGITPPPSGGGTVTPPGGGTVGDGDIVIVIGGSDASAAGDGIYSDLPPTGDSAITLAGIIAAGLFGGLILMLVGLYFSRRGQGKRSQR